MKKPRVAIITNNTLTGIGLSSLLTDLIPFAEICLYTNCMEAMNSDSESPFFHFFIDAQLYNTLQGEIMKRHTIFFGNDEALQNLPPETHTINTALALDELTRTLMILQHGAHSHFNRYPNEISQQLKKQDEQQTALLTQREIEVLKHVAQGKASKEIAQELHISLHTVHTHRKNIMDKLQAHSATKIMAYAVNHGYLSLDNNKQQ